MKRKNLHLLSLLLCLLAVCPANAQALHSLNLRFVPVAGKILLKKENDYYRLSMGKDSVQVSMLRFYISGISLLSGGRAVWKEKNSFHLVDMWEPERMSIMLAVPKGMHYDQIRFNLGIDSITNAGGARGGELDATKGMYWAWHSGYINFKLEGNSLLCRTRKQAFQFHLGGFRDGTYCMQQMSFKVPENTTIVVGADILQFLEEADLATQAEIMTPGPEAIRLSGSAARMFYILSAP